MNLNYLMTYVSRTLHTAVYQFSLSFTDVTIVCERKDFPEDLQNHFSDLFIFNHLFKNNLLLSSTSGYPKIYSDSNGLSYNILFSQDSIFVIGPILLSTESRSKHTLPEASFHKDWMGFLFECEMADFIDVSLLLYNLFVKEPVTVNQVISFNCLEDKLSNEIFENFSSNVFNNREYSVKHNPYDQEVREFSSIRNGDPEGLERSWAEDYAGEIGTLSKNPLRHYKYLGIVLVTLASRAAMEAGIHPETAYTLSDNYILKIDEATTYQGAMQLGRQAEYQYALLVADFKKGATNLPQKKIVDSRVLKCKDYIFSHLHEKIAIPDIAAALYLNPNYLSDLFKKQEGISIGDFIMREKIKLTQNLLTYSQYSYIEIASYLSFSSQSHLGKQFKKITGLTLKQYREQYGVKSFTS